jgi:hypothetical protein
MKVKVEGPITGGTRGRPFAGSMLDIEKLGYQEEEYLLASRQAFTTLKIPSPGAMVFGLLNPPMNQNSAHVYSYTVLETPGHSMDLLYCSGTTSL